jgi:hypothetical protein
VGKALLESKGKSMIHLQKTHPFLHYYTIQQFIAWVSPKTDLSVIWRNGIIVRSPAGLFKVEGNFNNNTIFLSIEDTIDIGLIKDIIYKIEGASEANLLGWTETINKREFEIYENDEYPITHYKIATVAKVNKNDIDHLPAITHVRPKEIVFTYAKEQLCALEAWTSVRSCVFV